MTYTLVATGYPISKFDPSSAALPVVTDAGVFIPTASLPALLTAAAANGVPIVQPGLTVAGPPPSPGRWSVGDRFSDRYGDTFGQPWAHGEVYGDLRADDAGVVYQFTPTGPWVGTWVVVGRRA